MPRRYSAKKGGRNKSRRLRGGTPSESVKKARESFENALAAAKKTAAHVGDGFGHGADAARKASTTATMGATDTFKPKDDNNKKDKNGKPMGDKDQFNFNSSAPPAPLTAPAKPPAPPTGAEPPPAP